MPTPPLERAKIALEGLSLGDAFGERFFVLDPGPRIAARSLPSGPWRWTDDTAMALSVVEVLEAHGAIERDALASAFARRYHAEPARGYGGTAHGILDAIQRGLPWEVVAAAPFDGTGSMGNGGAMRVAPVGAFFADDLERVAAEARASAEPTHQHPEGQAGAIAIAIAAAWAARRREPELGPTDDLFATVLSRTPAGPTRAGIERARDLGPISVQDAAMTLGNGSRVIAIDTVPFCLWSIAQGVDDYEDALWRTVAGLGDRDTTCAIVGGVVALAVGRAGLPEAWLKLREPLP